jgi:HEAT repeat protein
MLRPQLETGAVSPADALAQLAEALPGSPRAKRAEAYHLIGAIAGRAFDAPWEIAERAAWTLLGAVLAVDAPSERRELLAAMGRGFRNVWLLPYVHARLADDDADTVEAAITAAGGLGFPGLEAALATFLDDDTPRPLRLAAVRALGRAGAVSASARLAQLVGDEPPIAAAALTALTEIRSPAAAAAAAAACAGDPPRELLLAAVRYLAEMGDDAVLPVLRRLGRDADAELRLAAAQAARTLQAVARGDAGAQLLAALTERDRVVRALLARRLRLLPIADVLAEAEVLLAEDAEGVVQVVGELRTPEVTHFLMAVAADTARDVTVRARAAGAVEADEPWERDALATAALDDKLDERVRVAAAQALGAFASLDELLGRLASLAASTSPALRGAFLWALQLAARPRELGSVQRERVEALVRAALADADPGVRRRAAYVAGNLRLDALAPVLIELAKQAADRVEIRVAAFVGLEELARGDLAGAVAALFRREEETSALTPASRAVLAAVAQAPARPDLGHLAGKLGQLLVAPDPARREAGLRLAGLAAGAIPVAHILPLAADPAPRVREQSLAALGRLVAAGAPGDAAAVDAALDAALDDPDDGLRERAAEALLLIGGERALGRLLDYVSGESDRRARAAVAQKIEVPPPLRAGLRPAVDRALERVGADDPAWEALCRLKIALLEGAGPAADGPAPPAVAVDDAIAALFPMWRQLSAVSGFQPLARSLRTAEALYASTAGAADGDPSPPIILWMKCLEGYVHAWLSRRLQQRQNALLWDHAERLAGPVWPSYSRWLADRWADQVDVGGMRVDVPLRAVPNALRELLERRQKRLDSPLSVTEWARLMVLLGVDHPSGAKNTLAIAAKSPEQVVKVAHRLSVLAAVRNACTHRTAPPRAAVDVFRRSYYTGFEELTGMA